MGNHNGVSGESAGGRPPQHAGRRSRCRTSTSKTTKKPLDSQSTHADLQRAATRAEYSPALLPQRIGPPAVEKPTRPRTSSPATRRARRRDRRNSRTFTTLPPTQPARPPSATTPKTAPSYLSPRNVLLPSPMQGHQHTQMQQSRLHQYSPYLRYSWYHN
jgi:hypothetical protein